MSKKILAAFAAVAVMLSAGCSGNTPAQTTAAPAESTTAAQTTTEAPADTDEEETEPDEDEDETRSSNASLFMSVNGSGGKMSISRAAKKSTPMGDDGVWTIFMYLCGTHLESGQASATLDIDQMLDAAGSDNVRIIVQTGGTSEWMNEMFSASACERYIVQNGDIQLVDSVPLTNMGDSSTLENFLSWGVENYASEKMGFVFWDHGGGSISGVCFDEYNYGDSLSLSEINTAFSKVYKNMTDKFEFIGFDCCLMGTAETANILATYARYFYGSQETMPGTGWDYTAIGNFLAKNPSANGEELGKALTDSYYEECAAVGKEDECTFTILDLDKMDEFVIAFNDYANELYNVAQTDLAGIVRGVNKADNFGGNNKSEGYTNMVDIGGIVNNCSAYADGSAVLSALDDCIVYNKNGRNHAGASGLSVYYPLQIQGTQELTIFSGICISPYYLSLVDMVIKGYSDNGYTNEVFFTSDGDWSCEDCYCSSCDDDEYFDCSEEDCEACESSLITFKTKPCLTEDGTYHFVLDEKGIEYAANVRAYIYLASDDGLIYDLGETFNVYCDWESGECTDNFDGEWLALPDGSLLPTYVADISDNTVIYTSPINLNGKRTNLRIRQDSNGIHIEGAWDGIGANGVASREITKLKAGDKIVAVYSLEDDYECLGDEYIWKDGDSLVYAYLPAAEYYYGFEIDDVYGNYYITDLISFYVEEDGSISFSE